MKFLLFFLFVESLFWEDVIFDFRMISPSQKRIEEVKVGISNPVAKKIELHKPMNQAVFFHNGTMYSITTEKGDLVVSQKHKVLPFIAILLFVIVSTSIV